MTHTRDALSEALFDSWCNDPFLPLDHAVALSADDREMFDEALDELCALAQANPSLSLDELLDLHCEMLVSQLRKDTLQ